MSLTFKVLAEALSDIPVVKRLGKRFGLNVLLIDPAKLRSKSLKDEEFGDYWCSQDSKEVKEGDVWIASTLSPQEIKYAIEQAYHRIKFIKSGMSKNDSYDIALAITKAHREKSEKKFLKNTNVISFSKVYKNKLGEITQSDGTVSIWVVKGRMVRDIFRTDYVEGGHGIVYPWLPRKEIWIDDTVPVGERKYIIKHESNERQDMLNGLDYEAAHERAAMAEFEMRQSK